MCVVSLCRIRYVHQVTLTDPSCMFHIYCDILRARRFRINDISIGDDVNTVILSSVENCAGVVSGCIPTMLPIWQFLRYGKQRFKSTQQSTSHPPSHKHLGLKLSIIKKPLWSINGPHELERKNNSRSFKRLQNSGNEDYSGDRVHKSSLISKLAPSRATNPLRVPPEVHHFSAVTPLKGDTAKTCPSKR